MARELCVVDTAPLAELVSDFIQTWTQGRPHSGGRYAGRTVRVGVVPVRAVDYLVAETDRIAHLAPDRERLAPQRGVTRARIASVLARDAVTGLPRNRHTPLSVADALASAIGHPEAFYDGTLPVMVNPRASRAARMEASSLCCGGSLTGTGAPSDNSLLG